MVRRRLLHVSLGLVALVVVVLVVAHAPFVRARVLAWVVERADADLGLQISATSLNYNIFSLTAELGAVELRAKNSETAFFTAEAVRVDVPWSIVGGTIGVQSLEVNRPRLNVVRRPDGMLNLPVLARETQEPSRPLGPIEIDRLHIRDLELRYADAPAQVSVDGRGVTLALDRPLSGRLEGTLAMSGGATIRMRDQETTVDALNGRLGFDGRALAIDELTARLPEGDVRIDGGLDLLASEPRADLRYSGHANLARLAPWIRVDPAPSGRVVFSGRVEGPFDRLGAAIELQGEQLAWSTLDSVSLHARAAVTGTVATVESLRVRLVGGEVTGDATVPLDATGAGRANLRWRGLDVAAITAAAAVDFGGLRLASSADGTATFDWVGQEFLAGRGTLDTRLTGAPGSRRALSVDGRSVLRLDAGRWNLSLDHRLDGFGALSGETNGRLEASDLAASTIAGRVSAQVPQIDTAIQRLVAAGLTIDLQALEPLRASADVSAVLDGTLRSPRATGSLEASGLRYAEVGPARARADFVATTRQVALEPAHVELGPNALDARAVLGLESNTVSADATATLVDLDSLATMVPAVPAEWRPEGSARVEARVSGALDNPTVAATLSSDDMRVAGQTIRTVRGSTRLENRVVFVDRLELTQDVGRLNVTGRYGIRDERYTFEATGTDVVVAPIVRRSSSAAATRPADAGDDQPIPIDARLSFGFTGEGTLTSPSARGSADVARLTWNGYDLGDGRVEAVVEQGAAHVTASLPRFPAAIDGTMRLAPPRPFTATARLADATLARLVATASPTASVIDPGILRGAVTLDATATGTFDEIGAAEVSVDVRMTDVAISGVPIQLDRPARLRYAGRQFVVEGLALRAGQTTLVASGRVGASAGDGEALTATLDGSLSDLQPFARLAPGLKDLDLSGTINASIRAAGTFDAAQIDGEFAVDAATLASGALPPVRDVTLRAAYTRGLLDLQTLRAEWQGAVATVTGQVPITLLGDRVPEAYRRRLPDLPRSARGLVRIDSVTQTVLSPFLDPDTVSEIVGRADALASIEARSLSLEGVTADVTLEQAEVELARVPIAQTRPTRLRLAEGRLSVVEWAWAGAGTRLNVGGAAVLLGEKPQLNLTARGTLDLRMLGAFSRDVVTNGTAALDISVSGSRDAPALAGQVLVRDGSAIVRDPRIAVTGLEGGLDLAGDRIVLREVTANANGGNVRLAGDVQFPGFELAGGTLTISGRGLAFEAPAGLRTEVDTDLQLALSRTAPSLTGTVTILRGSYREPLSLTNQLLAGAQALSATPAEDDGEPSLVERMGLGIAIVSAQDIRVDNNYGRLDIGSNLRVVGTLGQPALAGRLTVQEGGEVYLGGRTYRVRRGSVDFTSATRIEPDIDLALETRVQRYDITLQVGGTLETIEASLSSPGVSQADVISLLLTGKTSDRDGGGDVQPEVARGQLLTLLSGEILGFAGRAVGLDTVQVSRGLGAAASTFDLLGTDVDPNTRLTLGKNLARNVTLVFSQNLRESGDITWIATYQPVRNFEVRGTTQDDSTRSYEFRHDLDFGGSRGVPPSAMARVNGVRPQPSRVVAVTFAGRIGFDERELKRLLRHKVGDVFDFYRWQQDREHLQRFYYERGFLEARVTAQRKDAPSLGEQPGLVLDYAIDRGPRTDLVVDGYALPERLMERMKRAWAQAVFDGFLIEDLETMVTEQLFADGYLRAQVKGAVAAAADDGATKQIALRIEPGARFEEARIVFSGHERLSTDALDLLVRARGLEVAAWLQPDQLETTIERQYQSLGYLEAVVVADAPVISQGTATLPVRITEGRPFAIGTVDVRGTVAKPERDVREAFGLEAGAAYVPGSLEPARRAVERLYLRDGHNDARVSVTSRVDREQGRVNLALAVEEGRQQLLSRIELAGAETMSRALVERALALEPGSPADLSNVQRAQKRLYDTGVFRAADIELEPVEGASGGADGAQQMRAVVRLQALPTYRFRSGFRVSDRVGPTEIGREVQPAFVVDLLRRNLLGRAITTGVSGQVERHRKLARAVVSVPDLFGLPVVSNVYLTRSRETISLANETAFVDDVSAISAEQRFRPAPRMSVTYGYTFSRSHLFEPEPNPFLPPLDLRVDVARLTGAFAWDTRDDPANARSGWFQSSGLELGAPSLGSNLRFVRYLAQQYYFRGVGPGLVLGSAFRFGVGHDFDSGALQFDDRFRAGGATTVRGFAEDGLGELDFRGDSTRGNGLLLVNQEVRFPIFKWLRGVGFVDAGNVFTKVRDVSLGRLEVGTGVGVRIHSPFLLLRFDYGVPLTRRDREPAGRWYFGIGQAF